MKFFIITLCVLFQTGVAWGQIVMQGAVQAANVGPAVTTTVAAEVQQPTTTVQQVSTTVNTSAAQQFSAEYLAVTSPTSKKSAAITTTSSYTRDISGITLSRPAAATLSACQQSATCQCSSSSNSNASIAARGTNGSGKLFSCVRAYDKIKPVYTNGVVTFGEW